MLICTPQQIHLIPLYCHHCSAPFCWDFFLGFSPLTGNLISQSKISILNFVTDEAGFQKILGFFGV